MPGSITDLSFQNQFYVLSFDSLAKVAHLVVLEIFPPNHGGIVGFLYNNVRSQPSCV